MAMKIECPGCGVSLKYSQAHTGQEIACPKCHEAVGIPPAVAQHAELAPRDDAEWESLVDDAINEADRPENARQNVRHRPNRANPPVRFGKLAILTRNVPQTCVCILLIAVVIGALLFDEWGVSAVIVCLTTAVGVIVPYIAYMQIVTCLLAIEENTRLRA